MITQKHNTSQECARVPKHYHTSARYFSRVLKSSTKKPILLRSSYPRNENSQEFSRILKRSHTKARCFSRVLKSSQEFTHKSIILLKSPHPRTQEVARVLKTSHTRAQEFFRVRVLTPDQNTSQEFPSEKEFTRILKSFHTSTQ